jgi:hypothetical protein
MENAGLGRPGLADELDRIDAKLVDQLADRLTRDVDWNALFRAD